MAGCPASFKKKVRNAIVPCYDICHIPDLDQHYLQGRKPITPRKEKAEGIAHLS
jgi:hypothetical protein